MTETRTQYVTPASPPVAWKIIPDDVDGQTLSLFIAVQKGDIEPVTAARRVNGTDENPHLWALVAAARDWNEARAGYDTAPGPGTMQALVAAESRLSYMTELYDAREMMRD